MPSFKSVFAVAAFLAAANAKTIKITAKSDNTFDPDSTTADKGDVLEFHFDGGKHSVVSGDYKYPCSPLPANTGFFSGIVDGSSGKVFRVEVNSTDPLPFYSSPGTDCSSGMVGIVNPSSNKTLEDYKERASKLAKGVTPGNDTYGGDLTDKGSSSDDDKDDKDGKDGKGGKKGDGDDEGSAGRLQVSTLAIAGVFGAALYML